MQYGLSNIEIWPMSRFEIVSETLINCYVWGFPKCFLAPNFHKPGVKIPNWHPRSRIGVNMGLRKMYSMQVGLVLKLLTGTISAPCHVVFYNMFSTVVIITSVDSEVWIRLFTSSNSRI